METTIQSFETAKEYYSYGWSLVPCPLKSKYPALEWENLQEVRIPEDKLSYFFNEECNIAIITGRLSNLVVIDVDEFTEEANKLISMLPVTWQVETPTGGTHYYFKYPGHTEVRNFAKRIPGVDFRGEGGLIIAPPSIHPNGGQYKWTYKEGEIAEIPEDLFPILFSPKEKKKESKPISEPVIEGGRNQWLLEQAGHFARVTPRWKEVIFGLNERYCNPPLSEEEIEKTIFTSMDRYAPELPKETRIVRTWDNPYTPLEIEEYKPSPEQWLIDHFLPLNGTTILSADPGVGKTWLAMEMALSVAKGKPFLEKFPTKQGSVLYIDKELGLDESHRRLHKLGFDRNTPLYLATDKTFLLNKDTCPRMIEVCNNLGVKLLVFDTFRRIHKGEENASKEIAAIFYYLNSFLDYGISVLLTHHNRKSINGSVESVMRGSTDIDGAVDHHLSLSVDKENSNEFTVRFKKVRREAKQKAKTILMQDSPEGITFKYAGDGQEWIEPKPNREEEASKFILSILRETEDTPKEEIFQKGYEAEYKHTHLENGLKILLNTEKIYGRKFSDMKWRFRLLPQL